MTGGGRASSSRSFRGTRPSVPADDPSSAETDGRVLRSERLQRALLLTFMALRARPPAHIR